MKVEMYRIVEVNESCKKAIITKRILELGEIIPKSERLFGWKELYVYEGLIDYFVEKCLENDWQVVDERV